MSLKTQRLEEENKDLKESLKKLKHNMKIKDKTGELYEKTFARKDQKETERIKTIDELLSTNIFLKNQIKLKDDEIATLKDIVIYYVKKEME